MSYRRRARKAYRMRRKRAKIARGRIGKRVNDVHYFKRTRFYDSSIVCSAPTNVFAGAGYTLNDLPDVTDFTALYDMYKINKITVKWLPRGNSSDVAAQGQISRMFTVLDRDDDATPSSIDQLTQYESLKVTPTTAVHTRSFKPSLRVEVANGLGGTANNIVGPKWLNLANTNVKHYGVKLGVQAPPSGTIRYDAMVTFHLAMKNVR